MVCTYMTNIRVVRYATMPEFNCTLAERVYEELNATTPEGFRYATLLLPDENGFLHIALSDRDRVPLPDLAAFQEFQRDLSLRTVGSVTNVEAKLVGNYRLL
jgi:hypothetical protein